MSNKHPYIAIVGAGNMGGAIFKGLAKIFQIDGLFICDRDRQKILALRKAMAKISADTRVKVSSAKKSFSKISPVKSPVAENFSPDANKILQKADIVILAVKPQSFGEFCENLTPEIAKSMPQKLIISIMAGVSIAAIQKRLKTSKIIRSMPNLPAQVACGITGWLATKRVSENEKKLAQKIFSALGEAIELRKESDINSITALSGSGPAYFFYLCEILAIKAKQLGFSNEQARKIAENTFTGAAALLKKNDLSAEAWRKAVTSKGGTTAAALEYLHTHDFEKIFAEAIEKAKNRAEELGRN